ncbi:MAG: hypothetical protein IKL40_04210 [Clostridia bacterium]|nr:hypothetical protein [Clostridia bacterium]
MKRNISLWQFLGFGITSLGGTLLHFLYDLTGESTISALISGVNESTWEHMKLLFFPLFVFAIVQSFFFKEYDNFWCVKLSGTLFGLISIPVLFYTYNGAFGKSPDWLNITIFFISAAIAFVVETKLFKKEKPNCKKTKLAFIALCAIAVLFFVFTFAPPQIPLFQDPLTHSYGI